MSPPRKSAKKARWTSPEIARLRTSYPVMTRAELVAAFPLHPLASIISTAHDLGLHKIYGTRKWREIAARHLPTFGFDAGARPAAITRERGDARM